MHRLHISQYNKYLLITKVIIKFHIQKKKMTKNYIILNFSMHVLAIHQLEINLILGRLCCALQCRMCYVTESFVLLLSLFFINFFFFKSLNHIGQYCPYWYVIHKLDRLSRSLVDSFLDINYKIRVRESGVGATRIQGTN